MRLHWREAGDPTKPVVVWVHGGSVEDSSMMLPDLEPFLDRVRALFPDTRGHGLSHKFERVEDYRYPEKAGDLLAWLDRLGIASPVWGGASMGAALSLWVAAHRPERCRAVVSISGPPYAPSRSTAVGGPRTDTSSRRGASRTTSTPTSACAWARRRWLGSRSGRSATPS